MQDIHTISGRGRLVAGGGSDDRRLRPHNHQSHQALKCPRCDSLNTKFCYYNNYNLSQPRHFCKSCRRYWTKGGVLRKIPVGGGCRKAKRSKPKQNNASSSPTTAVDTTDPSTSTSTPMQEAQQREVLKSPNSHSTSESSSLTATNTTATNANTTAAESVSALSSSSNNNILSDIINPGFETGLLEQGTPTDCGIFSEIGSFTNLITSSNELSFGFSDVLNQQNHFQQVHGPNDQQWQQEHHQQPKMAGLADAGEDVMGGLMDQTAHVELSTLPSNNRSGANERFALENWQGSGDGDHQGFFYLSNTVDQAYWSQTHWTDQDQPSLHLP